MQVRKSQTSWSGQVRPWRAVRGPEMAGRAAFGWRSPGEPGSVCRVWCARSTRTDEDAAPRTLLATCHGPRPINKHARTLQKTRQRPSRFGNRSPVMTYQTRPRESCLYAKTRRSSLLRALALAVPLLMGAYGCESELPCDCEGDVSCDCNGEPPSCEFRGQVYSSGEHFSADCNTCSCQSGVVTCTKARCSGR